MPTASQEEGPFYLPRERMRRDIAEGKPGVPLRLELRLVDARTCEPVERASFDIWHCDALGVYSGYADSPGSPGPPGSMGPPDSPQGGLLGGPPQNGPLANGAPRNGPPPSGPTNTATFLRGVALTDRHGVARFTTIFPGFYAGRVNHVHVKIRLAHASSSATATHVTYTGQLFFPETIARLVSEQGTYARHEIERTVLGEDRVFATESGRASVATLRKNGASLLDGYTATLEFAVDSSARPVEERGI